MSNIIMGLFIIVMGLSFTSIGVIVVKRGIEEKRELQNFFPDDLDPCSKETGCDFINGKVIDSATGEEIR